MGQDHILVIDEGTTSTRAIVYDQAFEERAVAQEELGLSYPKDGWVEQDGEEIWLKTRAACRRAIEKIGGADRLAAIGIANQRETTLIWDRSTGQPIAPAIVWQDRRTADKCEHLVAAGAEDDVQRETGLLLDPYFSATKISWLLDHTPGARARAEAGELAFGTVDAFLIWKLTGGRVHVTDATNASRTLLYRLDLGEARGWSPAMLDLFDSPQSLLPEVCTSAAPYGETDPAVFGRALPILSAIGDQQAALVGQGCISTGTAKITYGTGAFLVANTGDVRPVSQNRLLSTIGYEAAGEGAFALEGSIFNAGTVVKWFRDDLGLIASAAASEAAAASLDGNGGVYFVPAFTGLGAPHWRADARGELTGLTRAATRAHIVRAGLEAAAYQTLDLLEAFEADGAPVSMLRVDGGMVGNDWLMQFLADICDLPVERPDYQEMTALGAAALAGMELGWTSLEAWGRRETPGRRFEPAMRTSRREANLAGWRAAIDKALR
ncbi:MAG: glycerol kinase GlpK [Pseudomonadota bacterium]